MRKNELLRHGEVFLRVLDERYGKALVIDCVKRTVPEWVDVADLSDYVEAAEAELSEVTGFVVGEMDAEANRAAHERFTMIAAILPFIGDRRERNFMVGKVAAQYGLSCQTVRNALCLYLAYQDIAVLAPRKCCHERPLTEDEKNIRWALNRFFYTRNRNSLQTAYTLMLREKYCDAAGELLPHYPTIHQFRYFYRRHRSLQTYYISRDGLKDYQRNNRPLIGDGIQSFAPSVGRGMIDATVCDIYLVNEAGNLVGRPILTACIDAYSGLCCGYALTWEGGVYSLRTLMMNVAADKVEWCKRFGIGIEKEEWDCSGMVPGVLVSDMGTEYTSGNFAQIAELGVTLINLPAYRPELKGAVEKFFDVIQGLFKPHLKGKGVIEPDYQERGAHDYRRDACLTMADFERIALRCIIFYNCRRIVANFPFSEAMLSADIKPYASALWEWGRKQSAANLIPVEAERLALTMLPRTTGTFSRFGLCVNKLRYHCEGFTERYLQGGKAVVAYDPDDVSTVWLYEKGCYTAFTLIESRFRGKSLEGASQMQKSQRNMSNTESARSLQAKIALAEHIRTISGNAAHSGEVRVDGIRETRRKERDKRRMEGTNDD